MRITFTPNFPDMPNPTWYRVSKDGDINENINVFFNENTYGYECTFSYIVNGMVIADACLPAVKGREKEALDSLKPIIRHTLGLGY